MKNGSSAFLVDTNVLVYAYDPRDGDKQKRAITVLERLETNQMGALSAQVLGEFFVVVTRKIPSPLTEAEAERSLTNYVRSWVVYDLTELVVLEAVRGVQRHRLSYWDSLIWATAKLNGVPNVLSEDFSDDVILEGIRFMNPFIETFDPARLQASRQQP
jgi:predicted nucleic acid-binding protein